MQVSVQEFGREVEGFSERAMEAMKGYRWPGNVRELENVVQRAVLLTKKPIIDIDYLPVSLQQQAPGIVTGAGLSISASSSHDINQNSLRGSDGSAGTQIILKALQASQWNRNLTADKLGINRTTLYKKMKKLGLDALSPSPSP